MKKRLSALYLLNRNRILSTSSALLLLPFTSHAESATLIGAIPVELSTTSYLIIGLLLVLSIAMFCVLQHRFNITKKELQDITGELGSTRERLDSTCKELEQTQKAHKATTSRYQGILADTNVGMFQLDRRGKCTYVNTALQEMSGLYLKKAVKDGFASVIHPEDRAQFQNAFNAFSRGNKSFNERFRFCVKKGRATNEVHVTCSINKILNANQEVESYIGWVSNVTNFHEQLLVQKSETARYEQFVSETTDGYYQLALETPIALTSSSSRVADAIMSKMVVAGCNDSFASVYGAKPTDLNGKPIGELKDGFGPFTSKEDLAAFIECGCKVADVESVRKDSSGQRLNLIHKVIGIVEDDKLVAIWGAQRDISNQKRETAALNNKIEFLQRILNTLPADVHVKDTRCRYMYTSKKLADRTGIEQENWIGKTIFEVMPGTSADHDDTAIQTMKSGKVNRTEISFNVRGKSGWMESVQIPLVSDEGLVEGVVGLSLDISSHKMKEEEAIQYGIELEHRLEQNREELNLIKREHAETATAHSLAAQKLELAETELVECEREYKRQLAERDRAEETLRRNATGLHASQRELEEQLANRISALQAETDKRRKWEELLSIKEEELRKIEALASDLEEQFKIESELRAKAEKDLSAIRTDSTSTRKELEELDANRQKELGIISAQFKSEIESEKSARTTAEKQLKRSEDLLQMTQDEVQHMATQHSIELEQEIAERKASAEKLMKVMEELDDLKQQFSQRIEEETKALKQQLAQRQIREKALRQHEKDMEDRIRELEKTLTSKAKEFEVQLEAREGAEVQKQEIEQKLAQMGKRQQEVIARETQKLSLQVAEIRLDEVKLRKKVSDLQRDKAALEENLKARTNELEQAKLEAKQAEESLLETQRHLTRLSDNQAILIAAETEPLRRQLDKKVQEGEDLQAQVGELQQAKTSVEQSLETRTEELAKAACDYRNVVDSYQALQTSLKKLEDEQDAMLIQKISEHDAKLDRSMAEVQAISRMNSVMVDELNEVLQESLSPVVKTTNIMVNADNLSPEQKQDIVAASQNCRSLMDMLNYRSELSHLSDGTANMRIENCDLHGLIADVDAQFSQRAETKKLFFAVSFAQHKAAHNVPKFVETDEYKVRRILTILLGYAIGTTGKGRLGLHATRKSSSGDTTRIAFELAYTGNKDSDTLLDSIFGAGSTEEVVDVKYGLTLARRYIGMLDGDVSLEYRQGGITSLTIQFPFRKAASEDGGTETSDINEVGAA